MNLQTSIDQFLKITPFEIGAFLIPFLAAIFIDLFCHKKGEQITSKNASIWSVIWIGCAIIFGFFIWKQRDLGSAQLYWTGLLLEKSLAIDNIFVFLLIFKSFGLATTANQHHQFRVLYFGIVGAIFFRLFFLAVGSFLVNLSPVVLILFGLIILWTVWKMWDADSDGEEVDYVNHWSNKIVRKYFKTNPSIESGKFFKNGVTPLFLALVTIEVSDIVFSFDSMPVVLSVTKDFYLVITASLWAAAGLRSLYFLLIAAQNKLWALDKAIMLLLVFVAGKLIANGVGYHLSNTISLIVVSAMLLGGTLYSLLVKEPEL